MAITDLFVILRRVARFLLWIPVKQPNECSISSSEGSISLNRNVKSSKLSFSNSFQEIRGQECTQGPSNPSRLSKVFSMPNLRTRKARVRGLITAEHFITEAGYPQESHTVTTDDGYILYLHRLPRPNATRTVFFQHGILDTSLGWVCSGVTDSLAFSAWDQGYDVWLGNSRSNPPRHHNDPNISTDQYWRYTLNELGMKDIGAQLEYIHQIKCSELESGLYGDSTMLHRCKSETFTDPDSVDPPSEGDDDNDTLPYSLFVVGHSLGAAALLVYLVTSLYEKKTHYIRRIILMSPAGFHHVFPIVLHPFRWILPPIAWLMEHGFGRKGIPLMIPGSFTRLFVFKILQDIVQYPAIREFVKRSIRWAMNGDVSPWEFALQLPHYDVHSMPGISVHTTLHLIQFISSGRFQLYDYGSPVQNMRHYGLPAPLDLASEYWRIDIPVDIVAGTNDGVIPPECVRLHVTHMRDKGVNVSYREFGYGHLEFSATVAHDLQTYVLERLKCHPS